MPLRYLTTHLFSGRPPRLIHFYLLYRLATVSASSLRAVHYLYDFLTLPDTPAAAPDTHLRVEHEDQLMFTVVGVAELADARRSVARAFGSSLRRVQLNFDSDTAHNTSRLPPGLFVTPNSKIRFFAVRRATPTRRAAVDGYQGVVERASQTHDKRKFDFSRSAERRRRRDARLVNLGKALSFPTAEISKFDFSPSADRRRRVGANQAAAAHQTKPRQCCINASEPWIASAYLKNVDTSFRRPPSGGDASVCVETVVSPLSGEAAILHLYQRFAPDDPVSYDKCSRAARACGAVITQITDPDFVFLDPILGPCWTTAAETLLREVSSLSSAWPPINTTDIRNELGTILYAMTKLASRFPLLGKCFSPGSCGVWISAAKLQKQLAEL
ncbi:hypothetical protein R3P38DRAFT_3284162 [Favolaschia claudopus]|uniref:Uncharacterized protein n=1 Tax=Favolaschia claudopus TaxID=2862362 RepID=A0AAW0A637_9AGAR